MGKQVMHSYFTYSALWASKQSSAISHIKHYAQTGDTQLFHIECTIGKQVVKVGDEIDNFIFASIIKIAYCIQVSYC